MSQIHVLHENPDWSAPLFAALDELGLPYEDWFLHERTLDLGEAPPEGVFYNRMSASSHTRDHRYSAELAGAVLSWLESHGRRVLNPGRALALEISKVSQYAALRAHDIPTPRTVAAVGRRAILEAARKLDGSFITKHNRGGKGLGVHLFRSLDALERYLDGESFEAPVDGILLLQEYIESPDATITRCEFIGGEFLYAVRVDTSDGFELCPADDCRPGDAFCPATESPKPRFEILPGFRHPILARFREFLAANDVHVAAVEFIADREGNVYAYDVNTNTNYNPRAEAAAGVSGMRALAAFLGEELRAASVSPSLSCAAAR